MSSPFLTDLVNKLKERQQPVQKPQGTVQVGKFNVTPRLAGMLGLQEAEEKQSRQQMSHTQSSTQGGKPERGFTKEDFNLTGGIMQQPLQETVQKAAAGINQEQMSEQGIGMVSDFLQTTPAGGMAGVIGKATEPAFEGIHSVVKKKIENMKSFLQNNPDRWQDTFVHDPTTGRNFFQDMRGELMVEYPDVVAGKGMIGAEEGLLKSLYSFDNVYHPDPAAKEILGGVKTYVNPYASSTSFSTSRSPSGGEDAYIDVKAVNKPGGYTFDSKVLGGIQAKRKAAIEAGDYNEANRLYGEWQKEFNRFVQTGENRERMASVFNVSYLAHEGTHAIQYKTGAPRGGNPRAEGNKIFEEVIGKDPKKLAEYTHAVKIAEDLISQDPLTLMVFAVRASKGNQEIMSKYATMQNNEKYFTQTKSEYNGEEVINYKPNKNAILTEILQDTAAGKLDIKGTALEPYVNLSLDAFRQYQRLHGEAYARVAQTRAFKAASGKDPDIYKKNPQRDFDVPVEDISFPKQYKSFDELPDRIEIKYDIDPDNGRPVINAIDKDTGRIINGVYTDPNPAIDAFFPNKKEYEEKFLLEEISDYLKQTTTLAKEKANK